MPPSESEVRQAARSFLDDAFRALRREHVIPVSKFAPDVRVGTDYFGDMIGGSELEEVLGRNYPERFTKGGEHHEKQGRYWSIPHMYVYSFLEAAVFHCARGGHRYHARSVGATAAIRELLQSLASPDTELGVARVVTNLTTISGEPLTLDNMTIEPVSGREAYSTIARLIPGCATMLRREDSWPPTGTVSVVSCRRHTTGPPYDEVKELSAGVGRFLLTVRLLIASTVASDIEVLGSTSRIGIMSPYTQQYQFDIYAHVGLASHVVLGMDDSLPVQRLRGLLGDALIDRQDNTISSFEIALTRFDRSHQHSAWHQQIIDLTTALEASLIGDGDENAGLSLRLRQRTAALLACESDHATDIFKDVGILYELRSKMVHGGTLTEKNAVKRLYRMSGVSTPTGLHSVSDLAVYRLRDLVRRAILARLALAQGKEPLWPLNSQVPVDSYLVDDNQRRKWRRTWQATIANLGLPNAVQKAQPVASN